jgi:hypothetical protein
MELPNQSLRQSMLDELSLIGAPAAPAAKKEKIGRNDQSHAAAGKNTKNAAAEISKFRTNNAVKQDRTSSEEIPIKDISADASYISANEH